MSSIGNDVLKSFDHSSQRNVYDLKLSKNAGTLGVWFKTQTEGQVRHIFSNSDKDNGLFTVSRYR